MSEVTTIVERAAQSARASQPAIPIPIHEGYLLGGTYELRELLGGAEYYEQYDAFDRVLGRPVTVKLTRDAVGAEALRREARMFAGLSHPGLAAVYGYGTERDVEYLVLERLQGTTLAAFRGLRADRGGFSIGEALETMVGIAEALAVLHAAGYVHGNLSAASVLISSTGRIVVREAAIVADVIAGEGGDARQDLYALGVIGYELVTGTCWNGVRASIDAAMAPDPARLLRGLLADDPADRPSDAMVVAASLRACRRALDAPPARPLTFVIADDDPAMRALLELSLRAAVPHAIVHTSEDGVSTIEAVERYQPDALFLDLEMPDMTGLEVCMYLRGTRARDRMAICVVSRSASQHRPALARLGVIDAIQKGDVAPHLLPDAIAALLRRIRLLPDIEVESGTQLLVAGRYEIGRKLGHGGMGTVYEARHVKLGRKLALKIISPDFALDTAARARFQQEARLASEILHPNIVPVIDYGEDRHLGAFMVMEHVIGTSLAQLAQARLTVRRACDLLGQVTDALQKIHAHGIVHGDVKAENILVTEELLGTRRRRVARLLDFGLARRVTSMQATSDVISGTPHYLAPERALGGQATIASDVYALGVLGYLLVAGTLPFDGAAPDIMVDHVRGTPTPLSDRRGEPVDPALERLIMRAMAKDVNARHPSASAFHYELNTVLDMLELSSRRARVLARDRRE